MFSDKLKRFHYSKNYPQYAFYQGVQYSFQLLDISFENKSDIADLPCGHGEFTFNLSSNKNFSIDAFDISKSSITHAERYFGRDNIRFAIADVVDALKGKENKYDMIFIVNSLFLLQQPESFLKACFFSLKQTGKLFVIVPNVYSPNFLEFQRLDPSLNKMATSKSETIEYISSFGFKNTLNLDLVYASFYKRKELKLIGPFSNLYMILLNGIFSSIKRNEPSYHLLIFNK